MKGSRNRFVLVPERAALPVPDWNDDMTINIRRNDAFKYHSHWIAYLHEVARTGSIRGAAKALNVAPSAVSRRLVL